MFILLYNMTSTNKLQYHPDIIEPPIKIKEPEKKQESLDIIEINDIRLPNDFKGITFSNFKKQEVKKVFIEEMLSSNLEPAINWSCELICAGHFGELWEIIFYYISKYIHLGNPKIAIYVEMRYNIFRNIMNQGTFVQEIDARNNISIRKLFAEIICVLTFSSKKPSFEQVKIKSTNEFDMTTLSTKLKADHMNYIKDIFKEKDPRELYIAMNEFAYSLSNKGCSMLNACYWLEWSIEFETICKKRKQIIKCEPRNYRVENKFRTNIIWLIWDILLYCANNIHNKIITKTLESIKTLFLVKYTEATPKKRRYLLYYAIELLTENVDTKVDILPKKHLIENVLEKVDIIYKEIKKNEIPPKTEYLFNGLDKKKSIEKSLKQIEMVTNIESSGNKK